MRYCPDCGASHECGGQAAPGASDAVRIAEIERDRDISLARLAARAERRELDTAETIAETEAEAEVGAAAAQAEIIGSAVEAQAVSEQPADAAPLVIDAPAIAEEPASDDAPPPVEHDRPEDDRTRKRSGIGMW
jgi:hypothetical protein